MQAKEVKNIEEALHDLGLCTKEIKRVLLVHKSIEGCKYFFNRTLNYLDENKVEYLAKGRDLSIKSISDSTDFFLSFSIFKELKDCMNFSGMQLSTAIACGDYSEEYLNALRMKIRLPSFHNQLFVIKGTNE